MASKYGNSFVLSSEEREAIREKMETDLLKVLSLEKAKMVSKEAESWLYVNYIKINGKDYLNFYKGYEELMSKIVEEKYCNTATRVCLNAFYSVVALNKDYDGTGQTILGKDPNAYILKR